FCSNFLLQTPHIDGQSIPGVACLSAMNRRRNLHWLSDCATCLSRPTAHLLMERMPVPANPTESPDVTVIIVNYNTSPLLDSMFTALDAGRGALQLQVIVVDNASRDDSIEVLRKVPNIYLIENNANVGFGRANNQALSFSHGRYVLLLNTDAFVAPETLTKT